MARKKGLVAENFYNEFEELMLKGDFDAVKAVFADEELMKLLKEDGFEPFFYETKNAEIYKFFVEQGYDINEEVGRGWPPIHMHLYNIGVVEALIQAGADIEVKNRECLKETTPLHEAAAKYYQSITRLLIKYGADVHAKCRTGLEPLELVLGYWRYNTEVCAAECAEILIEAGATVKEEMKDKVISICMQYEKNKELIRSPYENGLEPYEEAIDKLCNLFDVERPVPNINDGTAPIVVTATEWTKQHEELWDMLVPGVGKCKTVQGEVVRIGGRIYDEIMRNAGGNWDREYRKMLNALRKYYVMGKIHDEAEYQEAIALTKSIGRDSLGDDILRLIEINVHWVLANPKPIMLGEVNYTR